MAQKLLVVDFIIQWPLAVFFGEYVCFILLLNDVCCDLQSLCLIGKSLHQLALQSNPDQPLQWLLPQMVRRVLTYLNCLHIHEKQQCQ